MGPSPAYESEYAIEAYLANVIERDRSLRQGSRDTYAHCLRNHVEGTPLGKADIRAVQPADIVQFWSSLRVGLGALRNIRQVISKAFTSSRPGGNHR